MTPDDEYSENEFLGSSSGYDIEEMLDEWFIRHEDGSSGAVSVEAMWPTCPPEVRERVKQRIEELVGHGRPLDSLLHLNGDQGDPSAYLLQLKKGFRPIPGANYKLIKQLDDGTSGFGQVWKAKDEHSFRKPFAVFKFCKVPWNSKAKTTFENEYRLVHGLDHQGIVKLVVGYLRLPVPVLQYEFVEGVDLSKLLDERFGTSGAGPFTPAAAADVMLKLVDIVAFAHDQQPDPIVHRDLKPQNVLVTNNRELSVLRALGTPDLRLATFKIMDFGIGGLARFGERSTTAYQSKGKELQGFGTELYASPEQIEREPAHTSDDVFSLGVMWYQLIVGNLAARPHAGPLDDLEAKGMTKKQMDVLVGCLKPRQRRTPNAGELAKAIRRVYEDVDAVPTFSEAMVAALAKFRGAEIYLGGLTSLTEDVAAALAQFKGDELFLDGLTSLTKDEADALAQFKGEWLSLDGLRSLTKDVADALAEFEGNGASRLSLDGLRSLTEDVADALAQFKGTELSLDGLTSLTKDEADALAQFCGGKLSLNRLTSLTKDEADALAQFKGEELFLNGLTSLTKDEADALAQFKGEELSLDGLRSLTKDEADALAKSRVEWLSLDGLTSLTKDEADALAKFTGRHLFLSGLRSLTKDVADALAKYYGNGGPLFGASLHLGGLTSLTKDEADALAQFEGEGLFLDGLRSLTEDVADALAQFKGTELSLDGLTSLTKDDG
jgi:serine/threonine protein kinase